MSLDTLTFLYLGLAGFFTVWSFRHFIGRKEKLGDFEYLAFSTFWGIALVGFIGWAMRHTPDRFTEIMSNPFAAAFSFSLAGLAFGAAIPVGMKIADIIARYLKISD